MKCIDPDGSHVTGWGGKISQKRVYYFGQGGADFFSFLYFETRMSLRVGGGGQLFRVCI